MSEGSEEIQRNRRPRVIVVGNANVDVLMGPVAPWPTPGTEVVTDRYELRVGGAAGNTGLALAALAGADAPQARPFEVIGSVGNDALGRWLEGQLEGVMQLDRVPEATALTVGLNHPDGQRTFVSYLGHLEMLPVQRIEAALAHAQAGDLLLLCGYFLLPQLRELAPRWLAEARERGVVTTLDTGWPSEGWTPAVRAEVTALLPHLSAFLPNREELLGLTDLPDSGRYEQETVVEALQRLSDAGCYEAVIKLGPDGALHFGQGGHTTCAAPEVTVQDTVGAGDTFNAALLTAVQRGATFISGMQAAVTAASHAVASSPRRYPTWEELSTAGSSPVSVTR